MLAVNNRSTAAMGLLLDAGADPEAADRVSCAALPSRVSQALVRSEPGMP